MVLLGLDRVEEQIVVQLSGTVVKAADELRVRNGTVRNVGGGQRALCPRAKRYDFRRPRQLNELEDVVHVQRVRQHEPFVNVNTQQVVTARR